MSDPTWNLLVLKTHDIASLRDFYAQLGIEFVEEQHGSGPVHFAGSLQGGIFEIYPLAPEVPVDQTTRLGFTVADVDVAVDRINKAGGPIVKPPRETPWGYAAVVKDSDGRSVELTQQ